MQETSRGPSPGDESSLPTEEALAAAREGSAKEIGKLLEACRVYLQAIAGEELPPGLQAKLGASDLVQDTLLKGTEHFPEFKGTTRAELARWLRRILKNHLENLKEAYGAQMRDVSREHPAGAELADPWSQSPSHEALTQEEQLRLETALGRLNEEARRVVFLRHRENRTFAQIGDELGKTEEAARKIWFRAVEKLQQAMRHR